MAYCAHCGSEVKDAGAVFCSACGRPLGGGAAAPAPKAGMPNALIVLIVLAACLVAAVPIIGIVAAIAIPNLLTAMDRAKQMRTMADLHLLAGAVEMYQVDNDAYPSARSLDELRPILVPQYIKEIPARDGWGRPFVYACARDESADAAPAGAATGAGAGPCTIAWLASGGKDGQLDHHSFSEYSEGVASEFNCDIVFMNGKPLQYPRNIPRR